MKKIIVALLHILLLNVLLFGTNPEAVAPENFEQADAGTHSNPYLIATWQNLYWITAPGIVNGLSQADRWLKHYKQTASISFANANPAITEWGGQNSSGWTPIGNNTDRFRGVYDGDRHTISNLYFNRPESDHQGLFGFTETTAIIRNLGVVYDCVRGKSYSGGLVGYNKGLIENCFASGANFHGESLIGGLVGHNFGENAIIRNSFSTGFISGLQLVGGFIGHNHSGTIQNCFSFAEVHRPEHNYETFGPFIGKNWQGTIINCYATGKASYWYVANLGTSIIMEKRYFVHRGFSGEAPTRGTMSGNYYNSDPEPYTSPCNAIRLSDMEMKNFLTFTGWDFNTIWTMSSPVTFYSFPTLRWTEAYSSEPDNNQLSTVQNLVWLAEDTGRWSGNYTLSSDINLWTTPGWNDGTGWSPIGNSNVKFNGIFNGNNKIIKGLHIFRYQENRQGFFGEIESNGSVKNLGLLGVNVTGNISTGGLAGANKGIIEYCFTSGSGKIEGYGSNSGGLCGYNEGTVSDSYSNLVILQTYNTNSVAIGGLVGFNYNGTISRSYSVGKVSGFSMQGGLIGDNNSGSISDSYYDTNASGMTDTGKGIPKTTEEMKTVNFDNWDWIHTWERSGYNYPRLKSNPDQTLPVTLSSFTATCTASNTVSIIWTTESESNIIGYHVLRSETNSLDCASRISRNVITAYNQPETNHYSFTDVEIQEQTTYYYWLMSAEYDGTTEYYGPTSVKTKGFTGDNMILPVVTQLNSAYPNPFNPSTTISFDIKDEVKVRIEIYNVKGQKIKSLINEDIPVGRHRIVWDGLDDNLVRVSSGVYFYRMQAGIYTKINKMIMMK